MSQTGSLSAKSAKLDDSRLSHAYIAGSGDAGRLAAVAICGAAEGTKPCMSCEHCRKLSGGIHPDVIYVGRLQKKREILVEQIREIKRDVILLPNEAERKVYLVNDADTMNISAQNAFLQMLEEPPTYAMFILVTENPTALLPTIRSRCIRLGAAVIENNADSKDINGSKDTKDSKKSADTTDTAAANVSRGNKGNKNSADTKSSKDTKDSNNSADVIDAEASKTAAEFLAAIDKGNVELARMMFRIDKLNGRELSSFISAVRHTIIERMRTSSRAKADAHDTNKLDVPNTSDILDIPDARKTLDTLDMSRFENIEKTLTKCEEMLSLNVSAGYISGLIFSSLIVNN